MAIGTLAAIGLGAAGIGSVISASKTSKAASKAADASVEAAKENSALAREIYGKNEGYLSPFVSNGLTAGNYINASLGLPSTSGSGTPVTQGDFQSAFGNYIANSDYGFKFATGANDVNSGYAGAGALQSGAAMKALEQYRQNLQSGYRTEYMSALGNQQGVGVSAASALAGVGQNYVNTISANNDNAASAIGNAALAKAQNNPFASALGVVGGGILGFGG